MRCKACNVILEDHELTKKDSNGRFFDLCSYCLASSNVLDDPNRRLKFMGKKKPRVNPVAKHAHKFNKPMVHKDRTKYTRKEKHGRKDDL